MTAYRPPLPQKDIARLVAPAICRAPALTALAGGFVVVPGEALGLSTGIITFILVRIALDGLLDRLTPRCGALMADVRRAAARSTELGAGDGERPRGITEAGGPAAQHPGKGAQRAKAVPS